jgi:hypothetical protein
MRDIHTPQIKIQGAQVHVLDGPQFVFDRGTNKRHEITVEDRTFIVTLQDIIPRQINGVANPLEYVFGISEK